MKTNRFPPAVLAALREENILGLRAGARRPLHRIIGIWVVVVEGRVFVRSWSRKPRSWWRTFQEDSEGLIVVGRRRIPVRAVHTRSERLKDAVSRPYREKYKTPGSVKFARDMGRKPSRETTTELVPR
jgi:hypothetical protein